MGFGSYTAGDWKRLKESRRIDSKSTNEIFVSVKMDDKYNPKYVDKREARDSEAHPNSTPIIIGVDVTGSMGYLSTQIIKESLNEFMQKMYSTDIIRDPQLLFAAIGDAKSDSAPLQVTQFESDIRIADQLLDLWLEGQGGDIPEDYELVWYFASKHTDIDCYNKRKEKGFCITIGDAPCQEVLDSCSIKKVFDEDSIDCTSEYLAQEASKKYELFHIMIGDSVSNLQDIIPGRVLVISKSDVKYLPEIIFSVMQISKGMDRGIVLRQCGELARKVVSEALKLVCFGNLDEISF